MSDGVTVESHSALLKDSFTMASLDDPNEAKDTTSPEDNSEEDEDFVVYSDSTALQNAQDISHRFESQPPERTNTPKHSDLYVHTVREDDLSQIRTDRHEVKLEDTDEESTPEASESIGLMPRRSLRLPKPEERMTSFQDVPLLHAQSEGLFFNGLVFCDTVDALYRPVVVINTRAIPHKSLRTAALRHLREALEPVVSSGPYVLIFTSFASSTLSKLSMAWVLAAYRELSHPFRKNVQHVILVRPNKLLKAFVRIMKMVVKKKAHSKIKQILYLGEIETVTNGEVTLEHLSPKVIQALGSEELNYSDLSTTTPK